MYDALAERARGEKFPPQRPGEPSMRAIEYPTQAVEPSPRMSTGSREQEAMSLLGTPVWADLILKTSDADAVKIDTVLIEVSMRKNIISTVVQGRAGTIKEYVSDGDFDVKIAGALWRPKPGEYPQREVAALIDLLKKPIALKVVSPFLQFFGIYDLVVEEWSMPQKEGFSNLQFFEIAALSDAPIELIDEE